MSDETDAEATTQAKIRIDVVLASLSADMYAEGEAASIESIDKLEADLARVTAERDAWKAKSEGLDGLLAAYRTGRQPSGAAFRKLDSARKALAQEDGDA